MSNISEYWFTIGLLGLIVAAIPIYNNSKRDRKKQEDLLEKRHIEQLLFNEKLVSTLSSMEKNIEKMTNDLHFKVEKLEEDLEKTKDQAYANRNKIVILSEKVKN